VAQVVARELGISMELIKLKASSAITSPNNTTTGGSMGSEMNCFVSFSRIFFHVSFKSCFYFF
jgi:xanthine dehydrogenase molybdopterin-binding subunit B